MKHRYGILLVVAILSIILGIIYLIDRSDRNDITNYIESRNERVIYIDRNMTTIGSPFYIAHKNNRIYKALSDKHVYWFRKGNLFSDDIVVE